MNYGSTTLIREDMLLNSKDCDLNSEILTNFIQIDTIWAGLSFSPLEMKSERDTAEGRRRRLWASHTTGIQRRREEVAGESKADGGQNPRVGCRAHQREIRAWKLWGGGDEIRISGGFKYRIGQRRCLSGNSRKRRGEQDRRRRVWARARGRLKEDKQVRR